MLKATQLRWFRTTLLGRTHGSSPPCPPVGPWRPVWIEAADSPSVDPIVRSVLEDGSGLIDVQLALDGIASAVLVAERAGRRAQAPLEPTAGGFRGTLRIESPDLWWPHTHGEPAMYALAVECPGPGGDERIELVVAIGPPAGDLQCEIEFGGGRPRGPAFFGGKQAHCGAICH